MYRVQWLGVTFLVGNGEGIRHEQSCIESHLVCSCGRAVRWDTRPSAWRWCHGKSCRAVRRRVLSALVGRLIASSLSAPLWTDDSPASDQTSAFTASSSNTPTTCRLIQYMVAQKWRRLSEATFYFFFTTVTCVITLRSEGQQTSQNSGTKINRVATLSWIWRRCCPMKSMKCHMLRTGTGKV